MKYGPIICDPTSEEAKALVGKEVLVSDTYYDIKAIPEDVTRGILLKIEERRRFPFVVISEGNEDKCVFIREVIEEAPKYRPYQSCDEMVADFKARFMHKEVHSAFMPLIWVMNKASRPKMLVTAYDDEFVTLEGFYNKSLEELFKYYTYLDGSPIGRKE